MKYILPIIAIFLLVSCGKPEGTFPFKGKVVSYLDCTLQSVSISEMDFGYVVSLSVPDSIGGEYTDLAGQKHQNCVVVYRTRTRFRENDSISGEMYLDDNYSRAYCTYHLNHTLPEGVCYSLD